MGRIVIELTNRCNLRCLHCYDGRHGGRSELSSDFFDRILEEAHTSGFTELSFTGGEPTTHRLFVDFVQRSASQDYQFGFVSNGWNFVKIYKRLLPYVTHWSGITFSMDGARQATHDQIRGAGSYQRLLKAMSVCVVKDIPFTINSVITRLNWREADELVTLVTALGSSGVRFGHYIDSGRDNSDHLRLAPSERVQVESGIAALTAQSSMPVVMAPGFITTDLFPCAPLNLEEFNIDWQGNVSTCCHLSGFGERGEHSAVVGNLSEMSLSEAITQWHTENLRFRQHKTDDHASREFSRADLSPCEYCCRYYRKGRYSLNESPVVFSPKQTTAPGHAQVT